MLTDLQKMCGLAVARDGGDVDAVAAALARSAPAPVLTPPIDMTMQIVRPAPADFVEAAQTLIADPAG